MKTVFNAILAFFLLAAGVILLALGLILMLVATGLSLAFLALFAPFYAVVWLVWFVFGCPRCGVLADMEEATRNLVIWLAPKIKFRR